MDSIDFSKYGLNWSINDGLTALPDSFADAISNVVAQGNTVTMIKPDRTFITFNKQKQLGEGSYGKVFEIDRPFNGSSAILKTIDFSKSRALRKANTLDAIKEVLIQIIIYELTKDESYPELGLQGPFCPQFFMIGKSSESLYIVMQQLDQSFQSYFTVKTPPSAELIKKTIVQLSKILLILYEKLQFNHRDLKPDNVMITEVQGSKMVRLIDFGFACLHYKNLSLSFASPNSGAALLKTCDSRSRDIHSFFLYLTKYVIDDKTPLTRIIKALLATDYQDAAKWKNTYILYNEKNANQSTVKPKNLTFETVHAVFKSLSLTNPTSPLSQVTASWAKHLSTIYINTAKYLTFDEYNIIPASKQTAFIREFFKTNMATIWQTSNNPNALITRLDYYIEKQIGPFQVPDALIPELFSVFISYNVTLKDKLGETILHKIARNPTALTELDLVLAKNNSTEFTEIKNKSGQTALDIALLSNFGTAIDKLAENSNFMQDFAYGGEKILSLVEKRPHLALQLRYFTKTLLHLIAGRGQSPQVKTLLDLLLAQNPGQDFINLSSNVDMRALDFAICTNNIYCINKLFELNAQITPTRFLFCLAEIKDPTLIDKLLDRYSDKIQVNYEQDYTKKTALMKAAEFNNIYLVEKLIMLGANITLKDYQGHTALNKTKNQAIAKRLKEIGKTAKKANKSGGTRKIKASPL